MQLQKKNEENPQEMTWRDCQDILSSENKQSAKEYLKHATFHVNKKQV